MSASHNSASPSVIDITLELGPRILLYPGDTPPQIRCLSSIRNGAPLTFSEVTLGCHLGTHVDAPGHFLHDGAMLGDLPLQHFCGQAQVIEFAGVDRITPELMDREKILTGRHLLMKTRNAKLLGQSEFDPDYCYLARGTAEQLLHFQPLSIGFDYYSLDPPSSNEFPAHKAIARYGIPVFVCLNLANVAPGEYWFCALPLRIPGVEGLPVRAILMPSVPQSGTGLK